MFTVFLESQNFYSLSWVTMSTAQKMKFSIKDLLSKCDQIRSVLWIWSYLLKKPLMENFIFCAVGAFQVSLTKTDSNRKTHLLSKNSGKHKCLE